MCVGRVQGHSLESDVLPMIAIDDTNKEMVDGSQNGRVYN